MSIHVLNNGHIFLFYKEQKKESLFSELLSAIITKFENKFNQSHIEELLHYAFDWCVNKLIDILNTQTELRFYQTLFLLHEFSCHFTTDNPKKSPIPEMNMQDYALYRRTLKLCLEHACELNLSSENAFEFSYLNEIDGTVESILYWGAEAYNFSNLLAEEKMHKGTISIKLGAEKKISFQRNSYLNFKQLEMLGSGIVPSLLVADERCFADFVIALKSCMKIEYNNIRSVIWMIHDHNEKVGGQLVLCNWSVFPRVLNEIFGVSYDKGAMFFRGLTLDRKNKMSAKEAIYKSNSLYRSLYRPMLTWIVDNKPMTILGESAFDHAIISLCANSIGWGKYPKEWKNKCFESFVAAKKKENSNNMENAIENILKENNISYDRNVKSLRKWNNMNLDINKDPGEIDFLFIHEGIIYIAESKHHLERFDPNNFRNDHSNFGLIYNVKLSKKIDFLISHINHVEEHFQVILNDSSFKLSNKDTIEGIFVINLPTYTMMLNQYRIVTLFDLIQLIGKGPKYKSYEISLTPQKDINLNVFYHD